MACQSYSVSNSPEIQNSSESFSKRAPLTHPDSQCFSLITDFSRRARGCFLFSSVMGDGQTILAGLLTHKHTHFPACVAVLLWKKKRNPTAHNTACTERDKKTIGSKEGVTAHRNIHCTFCYLKHTDHWYIMFHGTETQGTASIDSLLISTF